MTMRQINGFRTNSGLAACIGLAACLLLGGCAGGRDAVRDDYVPPASQPKERAVSEAPECLNEEDEPVECELDSDCCSGFVCGKDPELNPRKKFCIFGG
jgi:hypothetical protein